MHSVAISATIRLTVETISRLLAFPEKRHAGGEKVSILLLKTAMRAGGPSPVIPQRR